MPTHEYFCGNMHMREMRFAHAGDFREGHAHNFDHMTYVPKGALLFEQLDVDDKVVRTVIKRAVDGYNWVLIMAGVRHRITALEDESIGHCLYSYRTPQGDVITEYNGWDEALR